MKNLPRSVSFALAAALSVPAVAQTSAPATPLPDLDGFNLPSSRPTPRVAPDAEPTTGATAPRPTPLPTAAVVTVPVEPPRIVPTVRPTPVARPTPAPQVAVPERPAPVATPTAVATATAPVPEPGTPPVAAAPPPATSPTPQATPQQSPVTKPRSSWVWVALAILAAALAGGAALVVRQRKGREADEAPEDLALPEPPVAAPRRAVAPAPRPVPAATVALPRIEIDCVATRGGTNLLSVAVDYRIVVRNVGDALATGIRVDIRLLGMGTQHDALLAALFVLPIETSIATPFDLPPGTAVDFSGMAMHPKETIETVAIGGRQMVVPLLSVNLRYGLPEGREGQTARPFVIGIDPGTGGRLQPFRLDSTARMVQNVAIIAYTDGVTS